mmetsp:Transcript_63369/g.166199  ORF Transcript_63369/g.166199 Transcript_63369/m.166199 type:complete len:82 (+) Transcript_63369:113-358(+)
MRTCENFGTLFELPAFYTFCVRRIVFASAWQPVLTDVLHWMEPHPCKHRFWYLQAEAYFTKEGPGTHHTSSPFRRRCQQSH